ncbi:MAG: type III pantothenate kinase [Marmoricola sp.]
MRDGKVLKDWRLATDERRTADEWGALLGGLLREGLDGQRIEGVCVCATVPAVLVEWRRMLPRRLGELPVVVVEPGIRTGIPVRVDNPRRLAQTGSSMRSRLLTSTTARPSWSASARRRPTTSLTSRVHMSVV